MAHRQYAGFWVRALASAIDTVMILALTLPPLYWIYGPSYFDSSQLLQGGWDAAIRYLLPLVVVMVFWNYLSATPGKWLCGLKIIDVNTGAQPSTAQFLRRYFGFIPSSLLGIGCLWIMFDERKQSWHDKMAGTAVVYGATSGVMAHWH